MDMPLFAADWVGVIVGIIFLLVSAASAISNMAKEKNKAQPGKVKEKAALQKELEKFLQEAMNPQPKKKEKPVEVDFFEEAEIEPQATVQQQSQRRRRQQRKSQPQRARSEQRQQNQKTGVPSREAAESKSPLSHRERAAKKAKEQEKRMGGGVRDRIEKKQQSHIETRLTSHLESKVGKNISKTFDGHEDESRQRSSKTRGSKAIRSLLRDPQSFRQAIILNEILSPPLSRRRS